MKSQIAYWNNTFTMISNQKKRAVIWGSGSKCIGFMTALSIANEIEYVVDINPQRQGKYIPKFGKKIVPPEFLKKFQPDIVIIMNPIYKDEIQQMLSDLGLKVNVLVV
jgi:ABC-type Fe3+-hydroxamate transport system substrate-binding protein